jgi:hypothetical protein
MQILIALPFVLAVGFWFFAVVSWLGAVRHRKPEVSISTLIFAGHKAFDPNNFTPEGRAHQRRMLIGFGGFFASVFLGIAAAIVSTSM